MDTHQIHNKNVWMLRLLAGFFAISSVLLMIVNRSLDAEIPLLGGSMLLVLAGMVGSRKWPRFTMVLTIVMLSVYLNVMVMEDMTVTSYIFLGLLPLLSLIYLNYAAVALAGTLHLVSGLYYVFAHRELLFSGQLNLNDATYFLVYGLFILMFTAIYILVTKKLSQRAEDSEQRLRDILESVSVGIWTYDFSKMELEVSDGFEQITGYPRESMKGQISRLQEMIHPDDLDLFYEVQQEMIIQRTHSVKECRFVRPNGEIIWIQSRGRPHFNSLGNLVRLEGVIIEITERKHLEETIHYLAFHDELTGLANRTKFTAKFEETKGNGKPVALMFLDLDNFKEVNDTFGHEAGDELLKHIAGRLVSLVRAEDMVCRMGGDEFVILLVDLNEDGVIKVMDRIRSNLAEGYVYRGTLIGVSASIGISMSLDGNASLEDMLRLADATMYDVKRGGESIRVTEERNTPLPS
ncbi:MAG: sensor domain-containing diguanylate cyclase [Paenibacillus sp.]|uniref:sensor domain-containing diguanylate cyclase n=1 Tax=Paenibacillus sp. TaxID=58172 RepID=UPI0029018217|nr:sensor domain-containing diguanylate cyclase [Paenibacillus sp.]MDU2243566.1 sensor domain-containing diguanylate cyclase [Paenibacillus sp.]